MCLSKPMVLLLLALGCAIVCCTPLLPDNTSSGQPVIAGWPCAGACMLSLPVCVCEGNFL